MGATYSTYVTISHDQTGFRVHLCIKVKVKQLPASQKARDIRGISCDIINNGEGMNSERNRETTGR